MALTNAVLGGMSLTRIDAAGTAWSLEAIAGWGTPSGTLAPKQKTRAMGAWGGLSYPKARTIVLAGSAVASSDDGAKAAADALISMASLDETVLTITESGIDRWVTVRRDGEVIVNWERGSGRLFNWSIQFAALDPRKFSTPITRSTSLPSSSGGVSFPMRFPMSFTATTVTGQVSLLNPGNETGPVVMRLNGPLNGPIVTHVGSGLRLVFAASATIGVGEYWDIDCEAQSVKAQGQSSRANWVTSRQWFGTEPGNNTFALSASSYTTGTLDVTITPADK